MSGRIAPLADTRASELLPEQEDNVVHSSGFQKVGPRGQALGPAPYSTHEVLMMKTSFFVHGQEKRTSVSILAAHMQSAHAVANTAGNADCVLYRVALAS